jgi:hypothetical protein
VRFTTATSPGSPATAKQRRSLAAISPPPRSTRVSTRRTGAPPGVTVNDAARIEPRSSAITCTWPWTLLTKHTCPSAPISATATFGSTEPGRKFTLDASGGVAESDETSCPLPGAVASTGVRLTIATSPGAPLTGKHTRSDGVAGEAAAVPADMTAVANGMADAASAAAIGRRMARR